MAQPNLLLVEDEAIIAMNKKVQLERYGYRVTTCLRGEAAVEMATADEHIELVLMDIDLGSGMNGTEAARQILERRHVPVVFLSSHTEREIVELTEGITSYGYVVKHSSVTVLDAAIKMAFRLFAALRQLQATHEELAASNEELQSSMEDLIAREVALRSSEERFRCMVEGAPLPIFIHTAGTFAYLNPPAIQLFAADSAERLLGTPVLERVHPDFRAAARERTFTSNADRRAMHSGQEQMLLRLNGEAVWVETVGEPIEYEGRRGALVFVRDISERHRFEAELSGWNQLFDYIITHTNSAIAILDRNLVFLYVSERFRSDYRVSSEEIVVGRHHYDVFPEIPEKWRAVHQRALAGEVLRSDEDFFERPDGSVDYTRWEARPWYAVDGDIGGIVLYTEVITRQVQYRQALEESEERFRRFMELVPSAVVISDDHERVLYMSRRFETMFGFPREDMRGVEDWWPRAYPDPELRERVRAEWAETIAEARRTGEPVPAMVYPVTCADGTTLQVEFRLASHDGMNAITYTDVTERSRSDARIQALLNEKELLLREVHHRVKNNLMTMASLIALHAASAREAKNQQAALALDEAERRLQSLQTLYEQLHRSSKLSGTPLDEYIDTLVRDTVAIFPSAGSISLDIRCEPLVLSPATLAPLGIVTNELVTNAMKYAWPRETGGSLVVTGTRSDRQTLELVVRDDGVGLPQGSDPPEGLGLTIVNALTAQLGGRAEYLTDAGLSVRISVPLADTAG